MSMKKLNRSKEKSNLIREVYNDNFIEEIKILSQYLDKYNYVAMDTEFPGVVYQSQVNTREAYYRTIKTNVDKLKLIQIGITITDEFGNSPSEVSTWQFNLKFNLNSDQYSNESIALLTNSGINFDLLESRGIPHDLFGEYLITSGLVLNEEINWITFHGIYDFAYFLRIVTNLTIPETEILFFEQIKIYFQNFFDIKHLVRYNDNFRVSLSKLGNELNIPRLGAMHQAGSDSLITSEIFFKLKREYLSEESQIIDKNILFGIGLGLEDNDSPYYSSSQYKTITTNFNYDYSNYYQQQNMITLQQYNYMRTNPTYYNMNNPLVNLNNNNSYYSYNNYNQMTVPYGINSTQSLNNISDETKKKFNLKNLVED